ncbi:TetR/AcrR family transcriptional regulator [Paraburkholderia sp.]|uniref:TetR/AcrR family transcriptional regulator n=1 Tax=Paraburkholderia sp. TaxID=1926495 RepID=UPI00286F1272|nr:TetR/AcrR family transcriptional regulator [Paraburkholderia sp.]
MALTEPKHRRAAAQRLELRERILDAARRIVLREGVAALSMRKIAEAIGYSPASLYLHFASRDDIVRALGREGYAKLLAHLAHLAPRIDPHDDPHNDDPRARLQALAHGYVSYGCGHPQAYRLMFIEPDHAPARDSIRDAPAAGDADPHVERAASVFVAPLRALTEGAHPHVDPAPLASALWAMLHGVVALASRDPAFASEAWRRQTVDAALDAWFGPQVAEGAAHRDGADVPEGADNSDTPETPVAAPARKPTKTGAP